MRAFRVLVVGLVLGSGVLAAGPSALPQAPEADAGRTGWRVAPEKRDADGTAFERRKLVTEDGLRLGYTARAGFIPLREHETGEVLGEIFFTAYVADSPANAKPRPLTFAWGGGPGGAASLSRSGPRIVAPGSSEVVDNPETWLVKTDLVFIDPIGTGYSRMTSPERANLFYNPAGDAESVTEFMRVYLKRYVTADQPLFLEGGSYGTVRAPLVAQVAQRRQIEIRGLILSAQALTYSYPVDDLSYALLVPSYTAAAHAQEKLPAELQANLDDALAQAEDWALNAYLPALTRGNRLAEAERSSIVAEMARLTGLEAEAIEEHDLRVKATDFCRLLLRKDGFEVGAYDTRKRTPVVEGSTTEASDPTKWPSGSAVASQMERMYLARELGLSSDLLFAGPFGGQWPPPATPQGDWMSVKWFGPILTVDDAPAPGMELALPAFVDVIEKSGGATHALIAGGLYDIVTPYFGAYYVASRVRPEFRGNVTVVRYPSGHGAPDDLFRKDAFAFIDRLLALPPPERSSGGPWR